MTLSRPERGLSISKRVLACPTGPSLCPAGHFLSLRGIGVGTWGPGGQFPTHFLRAEGQLYVLTRPLLHGAPYPELGAQITMEPFEAS